MQMYCIVLQMTGTFVLEDGYIRHFPLDPRDNQHTTLDPQLWHVLHIFEALSHWAFFACFGPRHLKNICVLPVKERGYEERCGYSSCTAWLPGRVSMGRYFSPIMFENCLCICLEMYKYMYTLLSKRPNNTDPGSFSPFVPSRSNFFRQWYVLHLTGGAHITDGKSLSTGLWYAFCIRRNDETKWRNRWTIIRGLVWWALYKVLYFTKVAAGWTQNGTRLSYMLAGVVSPI